jgi:ribosomal protein S20
MTPKTQAKKLIKKFQTAIAEETMDADNIILYNAKQCALINIDEKINALLGIIHPTNTKRVNRRIENRINQLNELKDELENA